MSKRRIESKIGMHEKLFLGFIVFVDDTQSGHDWFFTYRKGMKGRTTLNQIDVRTNEEFDPEKIDEENGFLYFPYCIEAPPLGDVAEAHQLLLAHLIASTGARGVVAANFEDQVR